MRKLAIGALVLILLLSACGDSGTTETTTSAAITTSTDEATTTTTEPTTATTEPTTTTISSRSVKTAAFVHDDWETATTNAEAATPDDLRMNEPCTTNRYGYINAGAQQILRDANTGDILAIGTLGSGTLNHEEIPESVPPSDEALFWVCVFRATLDDVPLDRDFYTLEVEGSDLGVATFDLADVIEGFLGQNIGFGKYETIRDAYRG